MAEIFETRNWREAVKFANHHVRINHTRYGVRKGRGDDIGHLWFAAPIKDRSRHMMKRDAIESGIEPGNWCSRCKNSYTFDTSSDICAMCEADNVIPFPTHPSYQVGFGL